MGFGTLFIGYFFLINISYYAYTDILAGMVEMLSLDPRPSYHNDPHREYGLSFAGYNVRFIVSAGVLEVVDIEVS